MQVYTKLAQFRQRKAHSDGQHVAKKQKKKKKMSNTKDEELVGGGLDIDPSQGEDASTHSCQRTAATTSDFAIVRTLHSDEMIKQDQACATELESEISTTADDYSSEVNDCSLTRTEIPADFIREEEFGFGENYSEEGVQHSVTRLEMMENELAGKQQEIEELNRELEEMRAAYGTEGWQQLQEFEAAIKKRDDIITQLTANLQQARKEKDETMREFLELTEQSQKLQIQFQHLQASEALRNTSHSSTAADLLQAKQQILAYQQQLEEQEQLLRNYQVKNEGFELQVFLLQQRVTETEKCKAEEDFTKKKLREKETVIEELEAKIIEEEKNVFILQKKNLAAEKSLEEVKEEILQKNEEIHNVRVELTSSKQKERQCSDEIKQLMGTVEELQKRCYKDSQHENDTVQRMEFEAQRRLADLRAELEEVHGQQIVHIKQELVREHTTEIEKVLAQQKADLEKTLHSHSGNTNEDQIHSMHIAINELNLMLQDANYQREKVRQDLSQQLEVLSSEKSALQNQVEDLCQELSFAREQIQRAKQTINEKESKLHEVEQLQITVAELKAQLASASEIKEELEQKHEAEVTNYKIKLEMLEREKDAVLDRMAESQEAELERLRTQLLFSHEEELSKLRDDLQQEHRINIENLKDNMAMKSKQQLDDLQNELSKKIEAMHLENEDLITNQNELMLEISKLKDLQQSVLSSKSEEMMLQLHDLQKEIEVLRQEEKVKGAFEQEVQELQLKTELLEKQMKEREDSLQEKCTLLETQNNVLEDKNNALQEKLKKYAIRDTEESLMFTDGISSKTEDFELQKRIKYLIAEKEKLIKQDIELKEEMERLKNSFSFAEHNYQELQKKYDFLLKVKLDLEESKDKPEAEYKAKFQALMEEIQHLKGDIPVELKTQSTIVHGKRERENILRSETYDIEEVVEKDSTELMEKLQVTQHEKLELSLRLSDLSEQLQLKHSQICQLNEEVRSLKQDKEHISAKCKELELLVSHGLEGNMNSCELETKYPNGGLQTSHPTVCEHADFISDSYKEYERAMRVEKLMSSRSVGHHVPVEEAIQQNLHPEPESLLDNFHQMSDGLAGDSSCVSVLHSENALQEQLDILKSEQSDLKLQMEAQRICLSLVYTTHVDHVRECMESEKESALSALKEELQFQHAQELYELKKNQLDLQNSENQNSDEGQSTWVHLGRLSKTVAEECSKLTQSLCSILPAVESDAEASEKSNSVLMLRAEAQALQGSLQSLLSKIMEEYQRLLEYHTQFMKDQKKVKEQEASFAEYDGKEIGKLQQNIECLPTPSQDLVDLKVMSPSWEEIDNFKFQLEEQHAQEVERLRSYFHQQLKETEERYIVEIVHLQNRLQDGSEASECFSISVETQVNEVKQNGKCAESAFQQSTEKAVELLNEVGIPEFLEKQYQEKLLQEIAKVVVTMSVEFAQKSELARIANLVEEEMSSMIPIQAQQDNNVCRKECPEELDSHQNEERSTKYEEFKSLSREISEERGETSSLEGQFQSDAKPAKIFGLHNIDSTDTSSNYKELMQKTSLVTNEASTSIVASNQISLYEERLEDMRQELVRQYEEHQQATEILKQSHMKQMEWQKENQEILLAELDRLKVQLAEGDPLDSENIITEREQMLLEELESLKEQLIPGREKLPCELINSGTQTQNENVCQNESEEQILEGEDGRHEEASPDVLSKERCALQKANNRLMKILLEVVKTTVAVEETIGHHVMGLLDQSSKCGLPFKSLGWDTRTEDSTKPSICVAYEEGLHGVAALEPEALNIKTLEKSSSSYHGSDLEGDGNIMWSEVTDECLELTQYLTEHGFAGMEVDSKSKELVLNISSRLQAAVEKLLETINETTNQLEHAKVTQTELMRESFKREQEATEFLRCQEELQERLDEEIKAREQLALELSKAENFIDGYADEKSLLEKQIQEKTDAIDHLEQELLCKGNKLQELEAERQQLQEEKELLFRQKDAMKADAGPVEQRLVDAAVDAASQAELLAETEKLMKEKIEVQRQAEKEYDYLQKQVKTLETDIEEQVNQFLELEQEKNAELMDLRQQNQALEKQLEKTKKFLDEQAIDREHERDVFQQEIQKLEQQLKIPQRFHPINEHQNREVEQLTNHLKEKTDKCSELLLSKEQLQRDVQERNEEIEKLECRIRELEQALMISADSLQKVEERKQFGSATIRGELPLEAQLQAEQEAVDRKEKEIINLEEQLEQFREELENKNEEVQQLHMQLEIQHKESTTRQQELEQENKLFKEDMEKLGLAIQNPEDTSIKGHHPVAGKFVQIIQEKEQEINELHEQISKLQQQLEITTNNKVIEGKNEHIRELEAQIEYLKSDQERVKQNSEQEMEQLNEVIEKLQQELANIEHKVPLDFSLSQEDADNLKYQLDIVLAEKEALVKQVENNDVEVSVAKNELEETKLKMSKLQKELDVLKKEQEKIEGKHENMQMKSGMAGIGGSIKVETENQKKTKMLKIETPLGYVDENAKDSSSNIDTKLQPLQKALKEKDSELNQCYSQLKDLKEQTKSESAVLKQKITELEKTLEQKVAAALVSQAQLNVVLEQSKLLQEMQTVSGDTSEAIKIIPTEKINNASGEDAVSRLSVLSDKLLEMESELASAQSNLQLEKAKVEIAQKEAKEKEERLTELYQLLAEVEEKNKREKARSSNQEKIHTVQMGRELSENKERNILTNDPEVERIKAESAAAKEELNSYREKAEKFKEQLMVKEINWLHLEEELKQTKIKLAEAEEKIEDYVRKEKTIKKSEDVCISRTNVSCQTEKALHLNSCNQTSQLPVKNEEIQTDLQNGCSSEEVAEIIRKFSEKIDQMQELHAAEIMDMETQHISESEALKREQFIVVQELTEECNTLKDVIEALRDKEGIPGIAQSASSNARGGCSSDSSSDWSQGAYLVLNQGSDTVSEGVGDESEASTDFLPKKIKGLLRAIHHEGALMLSLTEFPYSENDVLSLKQGPETWLEERKAFLSTVSSLKDLITKMQIHRETELYAGSESYEGMSDWRTELLYAVQQVFQKEKDVLLAVFQTELAEAGIRDVVALVNQLEKRLQEQGTFQRTAMDCIQNADRQSLLMEINLLCAQLNNKRTDPKGELEIEAKRQELFGYNMEMQMELNNIKDKAAELQEQLNSERMVVAELKNELGQTKLELETTLKAQHKHLRDLEALRNELKGKAAELDMLKDTMVSEQKKSRELQWVLEKEKAKIERSEEKGKEELEDLKYTLENEKQKIIELSNLLELERELSNDLQKKIQSQETLNAAQLSQERSRNSELQVLLESERFRVLEISSALEREKELCAQLQMSEQKSQDGTLTPAEELLQDLQKQLDEKHDRTVALVSETERYKLESVQLKQQMEKERQIQRKTLQTEQDANILAQKKVHELESKVEDLQWQLGEKRQQVHQLQCEEQKLQETIKELQQKEQRKEEGVKVEKATCQNLNETTWDTSNERTRKWVFQQKIGVDETKELSYSALIGMGDATKESEEPLMVRQKLLNVSSTLKQLAHKAAQSCFCSRLPFEKTGDDDFVGIQHYIEEVILQLQMLSVLPNLEAEMNSDLPSSASLTERLLKQNAELTGFVSRLSEEKNNLRNTVMKLEEELRGYQQKRPFGDSTFRLSLHNGENVDMLMASEREIWNKEKLTLQQSLKQAEAEVAKLRAELRNEAFLRELGSDSENAALKRIYGRYLRAESFRKALIYQKKYLLLLLGGFQECEEATLSLIARMGGQPSYTDLEVITHRSKGFTRFRSAVRVLIAISRMKFLVRRWHRVTGYSLIGINRDGFSQNTGNELRPDSFSCGLELYGENRHLSYRSRSELESLRSPLSYQHRYQGIHTDLSPVSVACSQLQNYDPDRALTDYINRLEALQRRLGSVQSAPASHTQLHSGVRR
ncbi:A-kinase anchor protein 9 isoform X4 [Rhineura floridana]|uniref:A-kinase anchor protein 9 isoform X4 n=1 Tax=Rhineura floridana TaxID=261503 RepID=UPI002AC822E2|nr:A-kinase anchor protein 9 isoform X4 [Rhineura floridana]